MELKEKTKNKKQKKVNGKKQFFAGVGVGLLFSAITLILLVMFASCSAKENTSLPIDEIQTIENNNQIQKALTPITADFSYYYSTANNRFVAYNDFDFDDDINIGDNYSINEQTYLAFNTEGYTEEATYNHYHNTDKNYYITSELSFYKTTTLFGSLSPENGDGVPKDEYIQLASVSDSLLQLYIDNKSPYNLKLNLDISSSGRNLSALQRYYNANDNIILTYSNISLASSSLNNSYMIPAFMKTLIAINGTSNSSLITSFDAFYLTSLGVSASYSNGVQNNDFYEEGYDSGYGVGYADGYDEGLDVGYSDGHADGYFDGYDIGKNEGIILGYNDGYTFGYDTGYDLGYANGLEDFAEGGVFPPLTMSFNLINSALGGVLDIFTVEVMPGVSLLSLMLVPLTIALVVMVFRFLRG